MRADKCGNIYGLHTPNEDIPNPIRYQGRFETNNSFFMRNCPEDVEWDELDYMTVGYDEEGIYVDWVGNLFYHPVQTGGVDQCKGRFRKISSTIPDEFLSYMNGCK